MAVPFAEDPFFKVVSVNWGGADLLTLAMINSTDTADGDHYINNALLYLDATPLPQTVINSLVVASATDLNAINNPPPDGSVSGKLAANLYWRLPQKTLNPNHTIVWTVINLSAVRALKKTRAVITVKTDLVGNISVEDEGILVLVAWTTQKTKNIFNDDRVDEFIQNDGYGVDIRHFDLTINVDLTTLKMTHAIVPPWSPPGGGG